MKTMIPRKHEVINDLGLEFLASLRIGDEIEVSATNRKSTDIVKFEMFNDIYLTFFLEDARTGIFFQEIRDGKCEIKRV